MRKVDLDKVAGDQLLGFPIDLEIDGFDAEVWKPLWMQAAEIWWEDGGAWHDYVLNGFKGWSERTPFEIYCDLRFTYVDGQDQSWDELSEENEGLKKYYLT